MRKHPSVFAVFTLLYCMTLLLGGCQHEGKYPMSTVTDMPNATPGTAVSTPSAALDPILTPTSTITPELTLESSVTSAPDGVYIKVYKQNRRLELWNGTELLGSYRVGLGWNPEGPKQQEGDGRTPEGVYYVCVCKTSSRYYLSLGVSYPGIGDAQRGLAAGLINQSEYDRIVGANENKGIPPWNTALGGQIMIHGSGGDSDWTAGCIAVDNDVMDILWEHCTVGTMIYIYP